MKLEDVDRLPAGSNDFLTVTPSARQAIIDLAQTKPQGAFRIRCDIQALKTDFIFEWDDRFSQDDFVISMDHPEYVIVMDATSIAYILDEYTLDYPGKWHIYKNVKGPRRHQ
jgi:hypothetical protein